MPVLLARGGADDVAGLDAVHLLAAGLDVAGAVHDVEDLAAVVAVPVVADAGLEVDDAHAHRMGLRRRVQGVGGHGTGEVRRIHRLATEGVGTRGDLHPTMVSGPSSRVSRKAPTFVGRSAATP